MAWFGIPTQRSAVQIQRGGWLDVFRFLVASLIIVHHYRLAAPVPLDSLSPVFDRGYLLTDFFLIDSGYVLGRVYGERVLSGRMSHADFFRKRALRVIPAHLIMALGLIALVAASALMGMTPRHPEWFDWKELPAQFFLVQSYGVPGGRGWNAPTWSISALLGCYFCFPLLIGRISRLRPQIALALGVAAFALADLLTQTLLGYPVYEMPLKFGFFRALPLFFLGMTLAGFAHRVFIPEWLARCTGLLAAVLLVGFQAAGENSLISLALICFLIIAAGAIPVARKSHLIEKAAVISFSMFITNEVVRIGYFGVVNALEAKVSLPVSAQWALWAGGLASALLFAIGFHFLVDMPTQRYVQRTNGWRRPRGGPATGADGLEQKAASTA